MMNLTRARGFILICVLLVTGCAESRQLMPTPNLYTDEQATLFEALAPEYASTLVELIYVTDRGPETNEDGILREPPTEIFGESRSAALTSREERQMGNVG